MSVRASTSKAATAGEPPAKEPWAGRVAEGGKTWAKQAGTVLCGDSTRFLEGAGEMLVKGGQVIMACSGASSNLDER
jgi:hypothetical protein